MITKQRRRGYTLIEIISVMGIFSLLMSISVAWIIQTMRYDSAVRARLNDHKMLLLLDRQLRDRLLGHVPWLLIVISIGIFLAGLTSSGLEFDSGAAALGVFGFLIGFLDQKGVLPFLHAHVCKLFQVLFLHLK